jgi:hypothetical protein
MIVHLFSYSTTYILEKVSVSYGKGRQKSWQSQRQVA